LLPFYELPLVGWFRPLDRPLISNPTDKCPIGNIKYGRPIMLAAFAELQH